MRGLGTSMAQTLHLDSFPMDNIKEPEASLNDKMALFTNLYYNASRISSDNSRTWEDRYNQIFGKDIAQKVVELDLDFDFASPEKDYQKDITDFLHDMSEYIIEYQKTLYTNANYYPTHAFNINTNYTISGGTYVPPILTLNYDGYSGPRPPQANVYDEERAAIDKLIADFRARDLEKKSGGK
jgi:hypothetical protein